MKLLYKNWTEDVNKTDIIEWVREALDTIQVDEFGETRINITILPRKYGINYKEI